MSMFGTLGSIFIDLRAGAANFENDMGRAARIAEKRGRQMQAAANQIGKAVGVSMALFATGAAVAVKKAIDRADELDEMAQKVGASVQSLSRLQFVASRDGVDDFTNSMVKLNKAAVEAADKNSDQARAFAALGVSVTDANGKIRSTDQLFVDIAERFSMSEDGAAKAAVAMVLFGKSGADLIPMLNNGAAELARLAELADRLGVTIDEKTAAAAGRFNDDLFIMNKAVSGLATRGAANQLPMMNDLSGQMVNYATSAEAAETWTRQIEVAVKGTIVVAIAAKSAFSALGKAIGTEFASSVAIFRNLETSDFLVPGKFIYKIVKGINEQRPLVRDALGEIGASVEADMARIQKVWEAGASGLAKAVEKSDIAAASAKGRIRFTPGGGGGKQAADKAIAERGKQEEEALKLRLEAEEKFRSLVASFEDPAESVQRAYERATQIILDNTVEGTEQRAQLLLRAETKLRADLAAAWANDPLVQQARDTAQALMERGGRLSDPGAIVDRIRRTAELGGIGAGTSIQDQAADAVSAESERYDTLLAQLDEFNENKLLSDQTYQAAAEAAERDHVQRMSAINQAGQEGRQQLYRNAFDAIVQLGDDFQSSVFAQTREGFRIAQALSIAQATIKTYESAVSAYSALVGIPFVGSALAVAGAGAAISFGLAQVAAIRAQDGPGRAAGGAVWPGYMHPVGEGNRPELLTQGGKYYLIPGDGGGMVSAAKRVTDVPAAGGAKVTVLNYGSDRIDVRQMSDGEIRVLVGQAAEQGAALAEQRIARGIRSGRSPVADEIGTKFGVQPKSIR